MIRTHPTVDPAPRAVVFDLDGLLIDTECTFAEAARVVLARRGATLDPAFFATMMGTPGRDALPRFRERYGITESLEVLAAEYKAAFAAVLAGARAALMPGAMQLIQRLEQAGVPKAIATSSSREYVDAIFRPHGLLDRFAFVLTCDDVTHGKPDPEVYTLAAKTFGMATQSLVVLEDSINGLRAAKAAGCRCVVVPHEQTPRAELSAADLVAPNLTAPELFQLVGI